MSPPPVVTCQHPRKSSPRGSSDNSKELDDDDDQTGVQLSFEAIDRRSINEMTMSKSRASTTAFSRRVGAVAAFTNIGRRSDEGRSGDREDPDDKTAPAVATARACLDRQNVVEKCAARPRQGCSSSDDRSTARRTSKCPPATTRPTSADFSAHAPPTAASPAVFVLPKVTTRKGEKSFLEFNQHYAITKHLGQGSYSTVKQVTHRKKGGVYACKIVDKSSLSAADRAALSHEVRVLSSVHHVNIMRLYEVIQDDAKCYMVTELAGGGDLFDRIVKQGKFPEREAQKVTAALVEALQYCHTHSIIHRDVKPENVLFSNDDVKLCDFGFARQLAHPEEQVSDSCGTPGYAAPEILHGRPYGLEADVFSLGVVTYIMLCGYPPFPMKLAHLRKHRFNVQYPVKDWAAIDPDVKTLLSKMLDVDPGVRPSMAVLHTHPWIRAGKEMSERARQEDRERCQFADVVQQQQTASAIRKQLVMNGCEAVKYGRNGFRHRTKLRLSEDGKVLSWQPKLLKRGLLRCQNARGFASLFHVRDRGYGQPGQQFSECRATRDVRTDCAAGASTVKHPEPEQRTCAASTACPHSTSGSLMGNTCDAVREKRLWWRLPCRERDVKTGRTTSSGFTRNLSSRETSNTSPSPLTPPAAKMLRTQPPRLTLKSVATPPTKSLDRCLDDSIHLHDVCKILSGDDAPFFAGHASSLPHPPKRAVDPACVLSIYSRHRELHLAFSDERVRNGFRYLLQQATLPLQHCDPSQSEYPMESSPTPSRPSAP
ncbi:unnamed protein product [Hyaloperonospora brassicae]|uniref:non-specific serine/threonine protein kinase n=1 Tax=Hyaloperonospora brassicae TaxID=162125 RepID=A0AAV0V0H1_HYABA|nr:unnamed protein product [Hyaloperonospora brassicae]